MAGGDDNTRGIERHSTAVDADQRSIGNKERGTSNKPAAARAIDPELEGRPPAPTNVCPDKLNGAQNTLRKSQEVADTIVGPGATSDLPYWFARLYQYITLYEIEYRGDLSYPCFLLHFIPIFYDTYLTAAKAFMNKARVPSHWADHFNMASLFVDPSQFVPYADAVTKSLTYGVTAHIKWDMAPSLEKAYRSFSATYTAVPPFDTYKGDFFEKNMAIFEKVRVTLVNELVNRGMRFQSVNPYLISWVAEKVNMGLNIKQIYKWRGEAWTTAKLKLGQ